MKFINAVGLVFILALAVFKFMDAVPRVEERAHAGIPLEYRAEFPR